MDGIACTTCGAKLRVNVTGGNFFIREGSTLDNINFERADDRQILVQENNYSPSADTSLTIDVVCSENTEHGIFDHAVSKIKLAIYTRIMQAASQKVRKYS